MRLIGVVRTVSSSSGICKWFFGDRTVAYVRRMDLRSVYLGEHTGSSGIAKACPA
jgi:hypothetical protein